MSLVDIGVSIGAFALVIFVLPIVLDKKSQVPRWKSSIPTAAVLTYFVPLFLIEGLTVSAIAIGLEAVTWWLVVIFRPIKNVETVVVGTMANMNEVKTECPECHEMKVIPPNAEGKDVPPRCYECFVAACKDMERW